MAKKTSKRKKKPQSTEKYRPGEPFRPIYKRLPLKGSRVPTPGFDPPPVLKDKPPKLEKKPLPAVMAGGPGFTRTRSSRSSRRSVRGVSGSAAVNFSGAARKR